jgi:hypothetical protein
MFFSIFSVFCFPLIFFIDLLPLLPARSMALLLVLLRPVAVVACRGVPADDVLSAPPLLPVCRWTLPVGRRGGPAKVVRTPPFLLQA